MTVIRLDAATLARVRAGQEPVFLADENGTPVLELTSATPVVRTSEPQLSPEEWERIRLESPKYKLTEVWEKIKRGETL